MEDTGIIHTQMRTTDEKTHTKQSNKHTHEIQTVASIRIPTLVVRAYAFCVCAATQPHATRPRSNARSAASDASAASIASRRRSSLSSAARMNLLRNASISGP